MTTNNHFDRVYSNLDDYKRLVVKLLGRENIITHIVPNLDTASFDVVNRVLALPYWPNVSNAVFDMLTAHEVSHALETPQDEWLAAVQNESKAFHGYVNIIEDVRIDRRIRVRYPGFVPIYKAAYADLFANGPIFRGDANGIYLEHNKVYKPFSEMMLIDRINIHYSLQSLVTIPFTAEERVWLTRIDRMVTFTDAVQIARELYIHTKDELPNSDESTIEIIVGSGGSGSADGVNIPVTSDQWREYLHQHHKTSNTGPLIHPVLTPVSRQQVIERTVPIDQHLSIVHKQLTGQHITYLAGLHEKWIKDYASIAYLMATEFNRRKSARAFTKATRHRTGDVDLKLLPQYRFVDDIFRHTTKLSNMQSHGIQMLVDGSGSMSGCMSHVIDQLLLMGLFAYYANIPFQGWLLTDQYGTHAREPQGAAGSLTVSRDGNVICLLDTTQRVSFKMQCMVLLGFRTLYSSKQRDRSTIATMLQTALRNVPYMQLGGTPLYSCMLLWEYHIAEMKRKHRLDKITAMVISDGQDTDGLVYRALQVNKQEQMIADREVVESVPMVVRDSVTKRNHVLSRSKKNGFDSLGQHVILKLLFDVFRERYACESIFLYLSNVVSSSPTRYLTHRHQEYAHAQKVLEHDGIFAYPREDSVATLAAIVKPLSLELKEDIGQLMERHAKKDPTLAFIDALSSRHKRRRFVNTVVPFLS